MTTIFTVGARARVTSTGERRVVATDTQVEITTTDTLVVLGHESEFGEYRMRFGLVDVWVDDEEVVELCPAASRIDDHPLCILDASHVVAREWHRDEHGTQWNLGPKTEVPPFEVGHGRPDLQMLHDVVSMIDTGRIAEVRETVAQYLVTRVGIDRMAEEVIETRRLERLEGLAAVVEDPLSVNEERKWSPGDSCQLIGDYKVKHFSPCADGHPDGTITDVRTGEIVKRP